jgi:acyl-CoA synthetase (AMP-forming)/AMP-acid ligase II
MAPASPGPRWPADARWSTDLCRRIDLEDVLLAGGDVADCVVLDRATVTGVAAPGPSTVVTVAYVVPPPAAALDAVRCRVTDQLEDRPDGRQDRAAAIAVVLVRRIPRDPDGTADLATLTALPMLTDADLQIAAERGQPVERCPAPIPASILRLSDLDAPAGPAAAAGQASLANPVEALPQAIPAAGAQGVQPALVEGPPLEVLADDPVTVTQAIIESADRFGDRGVRVLTRGGEEFIGYPDLLARGRRVLAGLHARGLRPGSAAVVLVPTLTDYFPAIWGCLLGGIVPLTVSSPPTFDQRGAVLDKLLHAWQALGRPLIVTDEGTAAVVDALAKLYDEPAAEAVTVQRLMAGEPSDDVFPAEPSDVAMYTLSSGSTGRSKVIRVTHRAIVENAVAQRQRGLVHAGDVTFNWLPYDHVVPKLMFLLRDVVLGCDGVHAPTSYVVGQPLRWLEVLERYRVAHSWAPNFGYRMVADALRAEPGRQFDLTGVRTLVNAGEQCMPAVIRDFLARTEPFGLAGDNIANEWGMAETGTCATRKYFDEPGSVRRISKASLGGPLREAGGDTDDTACIEFMSMGTPAAGVRLRVTGGDGQILPEGYIGNLQAHCTRLTPGYYDNPAANREAFTADGWLDTGDLAFILDGEVVITGRSKELIVINGDKHFCHEIEDVCGDLAGVRRGLVAACGVPDARLGTEVLAVFFVPADAAEPAEVVERVRVAVATRLQLAAGYILPISEADFPRTTSGKIQRAALVRRLAAGEFDEFLAPAKAVPECVYTPTWQAGEPRPGAGQPGGGVTLILADDLGLADHLAAESADIADAGSSIVVRRGATPVDWSALRADLDRRGVRLDTVLYLRSYLETPDPAGDRAAVYDAAARCGAELVACCAAFLRPDDPAPPRLVTVSRQLYRVTGTEQGCYPAALTAAVAGTVSREVPAAIVRHVDLAGASIVDDAETLRQARYDRNATATVTAWRDGRPYTRAVVPVPEPAQGRDALVRGGSYLVAGGAGGIGGYLLGELAERYGARFLVLGRSVLGRSGLADVPGGSVRYRVADLLDADAVRAAVEEAEARWGRPLDGVLHLADRYRMRTLAEEDPADWAPAGVAKVAGTLNLLDLVRTRPGAHLIVFTSLLGWVPTAGCAAYGAGNAFADALAEHCGQTSLAWGLWHGTGINRDNPYEAVVTRRGVRSLTPAQGALLTRLALRQGRGGYAVGLDVAGPETRGWLATADDLALETLVRKGAGPAETADLAPAQSELLALLRAALARFTGSPVGPAARLHELGLSSVQLMQLHTHLEDELDLDIPKAALFAHPTVGDLVRYLAPQFS